MAKDPVMNADVPETNLAEGGFPEPTPDESGEGLTRSEVINAFGEDLGGKLIEWGFGSLSQLANVSDAELLAVKGLGEVTLGQIRERVPYDAFEPEDEPDTGLADILIEIGVPEPPNGSFDDVVEIEGADYIEAQVGKARYRLYLNTEPLEWEQVRQSTAVAGAVADAAVPSSGLPEPIQQSVRVKRIAESAE